MQLCGQYKGSWILLRDEFAVIIEGDHVCESTLHTVGDKSVFAGFESTTSMFDQTKKQLLEKLLE